METTPMSAIISPKNKKRLPQFVEGNDMESLLNRIEFPEGWEGQTEKLVISLLYNTGIRQAELTGLKESQIDFSNQAIKVLGKGSKERIIPANPALLKEISLYLNEKHRVFGKTHPHLFLTGKGKPLYARYVYNLVRKYLTLVTTVEKKSPHVLRHSFATHLMNNGAELNAVKELLGHASLAATQVYTHNTIEKLKEVFKKAHPRA
jgi:integrase/recombinase XerC